MRLQLGILLCCTVLSGILWRVGHGVLLVDGYMTDLQPQQKLVREILDDAKFDATVRPVFNHDNPINVTHRMVIYQILDVNEPNQNVKLYVWVTQTWVDQFRGWDPSSYAGIKKAVVPYDKVWIPDTTLYNSLEMTREAAERYTTVTYETVPNADGAYTSANTTFMYPAIYTFTCKMDILYFPFDKQNCTLTFGSWTYDSKGIDFWPKQRDVDIQPYISNEEWDLVSFTYRRVEMDYSCCPDHWTLIHVDLIIQRKALFYLSNLVVPTVIISLIAMVGFFMPASTTGERTQKVDLGINTLLAMSILLLMVSDEMPTTSDFIPIMGWFFQAIIITISAGTFMSSVIIVVQSQGNYGKRVPRIIRRIFFDNVARLLCVGAPVGMLTDAEIKMASSGSGKGSMADKGDSRIDHNGEEVPLVTILKSMEARQSLHRNRSLESEQGARSGHRHCRSPSPTPLGISTVTGHGNGGGGGPGNGGGSLGEFALKPPSPGGFTRSTFDGTTVGGGASFGNGGLLVHGNGLQLSEQNAKQALLEWEYLANILDRCLLYFFCGTVAAVTTTMILVGLLKNQDVSQRNK